MTFKMRNRPFLVALATLAMGAAAFGSAACDTSAHREREAEKARAEAAKERSELLQKAVNEQHKADETERKALAENENKFVKERADYRAKIEKEIADADTHVEDLRIAATNASVTAKNDIDTALRDVSARRTELETALHHVDDSTSRTWVDVKTRLDRELDAFKSSIRTASTRIKSAPGRARDTTAIPPDTQPGGAPRYTPPATQP
jgi:hypothetical protein